MAAKTLAHGIVRLSVVGQRAVFSQLSQTQRQIAAFATGVTAILGAIAIHQVKSTMRAAGDAKETEELFNNVFGSATDDARAFAREISTNLRASFFVVQEAMAVYQTTLSAVGLTQEESLKMTKEQIKLAFDIARAYNQDFSTAASNLRSSLLGVSQAGRKTGTRILQAELQQEIYRMGINKTVKSLDEKTKVLARHNALLRKTKVIEGQAAKESNFYNATLEGVTASFHELKVAIGNGFIPVGTKMNRMLIDTINLLRKLAEPAFQLIGRNLARAFDFFASSIWSVIKALDALVTLYQDFNEYVQSTFLGKLLTKGPLRLVLDAIGFNKKKDQEDAAPTSIMGEGQDQLKGGIIGFEEANRRLQESFLKQDSSVTATQENTEATKELTKAMKQRRGQFSKAGSDDGEMVPVATIGGTSITHMRRSGL